VKHRIAGLSIDVDSVASHLRGYGIEVPEDDGAAYRIAVPRALDILDEADARGTFFLIVEEAARHPSVVREIVSRGHEVASHSMTHRLPFSDLGETRLQREVVESKRVLEQLSGVRVLGFRTPSWDASSDLLLSLIDAGYKYDASNYPSVLLPLLRISVARRSPTGRQTARSDIWKGTLGPPGPHRRDMANGTLWEIPVSTTPVTRIPYYHTLRMLLPASAFRLIGAAARSRRGPITYQFHAVDFLGLREDDLDPRMDRHPGMKASLGWKLDQASAAVHEITAVRSVVTLLEIASGERQPALTTA